MRIFIVVAKNRPELFQYFSLGFSGIDMINVLLDRRLDREETSVVATPLQSSNRRVAPDVYDELQERGFVIVRVPA
jgi:hypothetical protein